ncbi:MAG TPA: AAA family ATPase [Allosphingosinicella sp.]|jgi:exopolysaccharide/PEP-CTERM locus tyrosine autokinase
MNQHSSLRTSGSLLERAADMYGFGSGLNAPLPPLPEAVEAEPAAAPAPEEVPVSEEPARPRRRKQPIILSSPEITFEEPAAPLELAPQDEAVEFMEEPKPAPRPRSARRGSVDRASLRQGGFILPDAPVSELAEEFRIVKRQLLQAASGKTGIPEDKRQTILVCSASPDEGKTFCAINLALSLASEKEVEVLLVDGDFSKPEILSILGVEGGPGLIDAIADPDSDPESFVIQTDVERFSVLPAGSQTNNVTELLASKRTRQVLDALTMRHPKRIVIFDSPPALMASPASILANKVGQIVMVVRADKTNEADLREAVGLLSGCEHLALMLNGTGFTPTGRRFGSYYGYSQ